jgi:hypothetical protein
LPQKYSAKFWANGTNQSTFLAGFVGLGNQVFYDSNKIIEYGKFNQIVQSPNKLLAYCWTICCHLSIIEYVEFRIISLKAVDYGTSITP